MGKVTLADLSRETGLSRTTISMILSRKAGFSFSRETVEKVIKAAGESGYQSRAQKRSTLFSRRSVMIVCPFIANKYYSTVVQTTQSEAEETGRNALVYATYNNRDEEAKILNVLAESDIGGVIFALMPRSRALLNRISKTIPVVAIADRETETPFDIVDLYNFRAGELIAEHLASMGHKHIVCLSTSLSASVKARTIRYQGLKSAWEKLYPDGTLKLYTAYPSQTTRRDNINLERELGEALATRALEENGKSFTAFVCVNDMLAYGALDALSAHKYNVPEDYSVCGCDNDFPSDLPGVKLTSVEHYMSHNARVAFRALQSKMDGNTGENFVSRKIIRPEIVIRASSGKAREEDK